MLVLGHRGAQSRSISENTLEAFLEAIRQGADGIECDIRVSSDRQLIVFHDATLHRVAGDAHKISELTAQELAAIPLRHGGKIPSLEDAIARIGSPSVFDFEIKQREAVHPLIERLKRDPGLRARTIISSFFVFVLEDIQRELPDVRTVFLMSRWPLPLRRKRCWQRIQKLRPWGVAFPLTVLNSRRVALLRQLGVRVGGWDLRGTRRETKKAYDLELDLAIVRRVSGS